MPIFAAAPAAAAAGTAAATTTAAATIGTELLVAAGTAAASALVNSALKGRENEAEQKLKQTPYTSASETARAANMRAPVTGGGGGAQGTFGANERPYQNSSLTAPRLPQIPQIPQQQQVATAMPPQSTPAQVQQRLNALIMNAGSPQLKASRFGAGGLQ